jgi:hypothetical protein
VGCLSSKPDLVTGLLGPLCSSHNPLARYSSSNIMPVYKNLGHYIVSSV